MSKEESLPAPAWSAARTPNVSRPTASSRRDSASSRRALASSSRVGRRTTSRTCATPSAPPSAATATRARTRRDGVVAGSAEIAFARAPAATMRRSATRSSARSGSAPSAPSRASRTSASPSGRSFARGSRGMTVGAAGPPPGKGSSTSADPSVVHHAPRIQISELDVRSMPSMSLGVHTSVSARVRRTTPRPSASTMHRPRPSPNAARRAAKPRPRGAKRTPRGSSSRVPSPRITSAPSMISRKR